MRHTGYVLAAVFLGALFLIGCSKRQNPAKPPVPPAGLVVSNTPQFENTLDADNNALILNNLRPEPEVRRVRVYLPPGYRPRGQGRPFPTLYLLHDFGIYPDNLGNPASNDAYFGFYELAPLLDRMIADSQIQPMIVVQADLPSYFYGGSFYTNSTSTARFFTAVDSFLVNYIDQTYNTVFGRRSRAVSGHGMGGYGALKMVLAGNDTSFGSVSALSAPLAFGDSGSGAGFQGPFYINGLFAENGVTLGDCVRFRRDTVLFPDPRLTQKIRTNILFALGAACSPVADTALFKQLLAQGRRDSLLAAMPEYFQFSKSPKDPGFLFPISCNGTIIDSIWRKWLAHDIKTLLADPSRAARLDSTPLYFSCGLQDELGMLEQNRDFLARLTVVQGASQRASNFIGMGRGQFYYEEYSGYPGYPANHTTFIADQLAKVLRFHSQFLDTAAAP
ncbi:MAG TPA: alpha/beta hydrolase-fold protein [candidate division Zixibacteria bacterium]|nr:alpha/beta hydrolase-fold protein [candidate division Zixibacteria bacterium]